MQNIETFSSQQQHPQHQQQKKLIVEYIDETELGPNYHENYIVYRDEETNENYIIDYSQKYKYVIRKKPQQMTLNNNIKQQNIPVTIQSDLIDSDDQQSFQQETRYIYSYVDQSELVLIDLAKLTVNKNDLLEEYYMVDQLMPNKFCVILQDNWNENETLPYISEDDVDLMNWIVNLEQNSNRKFIVDDRDNTRYYIIPTDYMKEFKSSWNKYYKNSTNSNSNSDSLATTNRNAMIIDYVDEDELKTVDLLNVKIQKDESYKEYYIQDPTNINHRWIVLPANWNQKNYGNSSHYYVYEDDVNNKVNIIYKDAQKRRFIVIKKTNYKLYLVPKVTDYRQSFKFKWSQIDQSLKKFNNSFKEKKKLKASKTVQTSSTTKNGKLAIVELPSSPKTVKRQDSTSSNSNKNSLKIRQRSASIDRAHESKKPIPRVNNNDNSKISMVEALVNSNNDQEQLGQQRQYLDKPLISINKPQRSNSANNIIDQPGRSLSGRVKKSVYFNENVKVSDGENNSIPILAPLAVPLRLDRSFSPVAYQDQEQNPVRQENIATGGAPPVKPREIKPMNVRLEFTNLDSKPNNASIESNNKTSLQQEQQKPFNYLNNNSNNNRTQSGNTIIRIKPQNGRPGHVIYTNSKT